MQEKARDPDSFLLFHTFATVPHSFLPRQHPPYITFTYGLKWVSPCFPCSVEKSIHIHHDGVSSLFLDTIISKQRHFFFFLSLWLWSVYTSQDILMPRPEWATCDFSTDAGVKVHWKAFVVVKFHFSSFSPGLLRHAHIWHKIMNILL